MPYPAPVPVPSPSPDPNPFSTLAGDGDEADRVEARCDHCGSVSTWPATEQADVLPCPTCDHLLTVPSRKMFVYEHTHRPRRVLLYLAAAVALIVAALVLFPSPRPYKRGYDYARQLRRENPFHDLKSIVETASDRNKLPNYNKNDMGEYLDGVQDAVRGKEPDPRWYKNR
jgi:hypothetical protein